MLLRMPVRIAESHPRKLDLRYPPLFILGPPRSGTTLVYQTICHTLSVGFPDNLMIKTGLYRTPGLYRLIAGFMRHFSHPHKPFQSEFGTTVGLFGPHEAGEMWNRWLPVEKHFVDPEHISMKAREQLQRAVAGIEHIWQAPVVNKNVKHSARIQALARIFPNTLFLEVCRDRAMVAQSIYQARSGRFQEEDWMGVKPREIDQIADLDLIGQVAGQVHFTYRNIAEDRSSLGPARFLQFQYEEFCETPLKHISRLVEFMNSNGSPVRVVRPAPESFFCSNEVRIPVETFEEIECRLKDFQRRYPIHNE